MAKRPTLSDITSLTNSSNINVINQNWDAIQEAFDNTVSRDGSTPNTMAGDLDLNGNAILNVGTIDVDNLTLDGQQITDISSVPEWRGAWLTSTSYTKNDMVKEAGNVYICLDSHTAGTFATDLTDLKWELMVAQSAAGAGTGDMLAANNLSDVVSAATSRANLGLGTAATENTVPIAKGGTGATDATTALSNLGGQPAGDTLTSLEALSLAQGDLLYATAADTLVRLAKGTAGQLLQMNAGATAPEWVTPSGGGSTLLGTVNTTSGSSVNLTSLNLTTYVSLRLVVTGVSASGAADLEIGGVKIASIASGAVTLRGIVDIDLNAGIFSASTANAGTSASQSAAAIAGDLPLTTASTSITFSVSAGSFDAGSIRVYGVK